MTDKTHWIITALDCNRGGYGYRRQFQCAVCGAVYMSDPCENNDAADFEYCPKCGRGVVDEEAEIK